MNRFQFEEGIRQLAKKDEAIEMYQKSPEIIPQNKGGREALDRLLKSVSLKHQAFVMGYKVLYLNLNRFTEKIISASIAHLSGGQILLN